MENQSTIISTETTSTQETLSPEDKNVIQQAILKRKLALAECKAAVANQEAAEATYHNTILKIYLKYHLSDKDVIDENGVIMKNKITQTAKEIK